MIAGERDGKRCAGTDLRSNLNGSAVGLDDFSGDGESESGAALSFATDEGFEDVIVPFGGDTGAVIGHFDGGGTGGGVEGGAKGDDAGAWFDGFGGVGDEVHQDLVDGVDVDGHRRHVGVEFLDDPDVLLVEGGLEEFEDFAEEGVEVGEVEVEGAGLGVGKHVEGEPDDAVEVAGEDGPAFFGEVEVVAVEGEFDGVGTAAESLEDVLDGVGEGGDGFAHGGESFGLESGGDAFAGEEGDAGVLGDGGEESELCVGEGEVGEGGVDVNDAEGAFAGDDGDTDGGADAVVADGVSGAESVIVHGVGGEDAFAVVEGVADDGAADGDASFLDFGSCFAEADDGGFEDTIGVVSEEDESAVGSELFEDEIHDAVEDLIALEGSGGEGVEVVDDAEVIHRGGDGVGGGEDHGVGVGGGAFDGDVEVAGFDEVEGGGAGVFLADDEEEDGGAGADLVAGGEGDAFLPDAVSVDEGAVGGVEVSDVPGAVIGGEFGVPSRDGGVGHGQGFGGPSDELWFIGGEFESFAAVRALDDVENEHGDMVGGGRD